MVNPAWICRVVSLAWLFAVCPSLVAQPTLPSLQPGLHPEQVETLIGKPAHVSRQILRLRTIEQWHYTTPRPVRLTFEQSRGRRAVLRQVHRPDQTPRGVP